MSDVNESMPPPPVSGGPSEDEKLWGMFAHLSTLAGGLVSGAFGGWGWFIGPLVIWLIKKDTMPFVATQAKEALNFSIMVTAIFIVLWILTILTFGIGILLTGPLMALVGLGALVLTIIAGVKAKEGIAYRYPVNVRLIK